MLTIRNTPDGAVVADEPTGAYAYSLNPTELEMFSMQVAAAEGVRRGIEKLPVRADCIEPGDFILGMEISVRHRVPGLNRIALLFHDSIATLIVPDFQIIDIERPIR